MEESWLPACLLVCFSNKPGLLKVGWALPHQSRKCPIDTSTGQSDAGNYSLPDIPYSQMTLVCVNIQKLTSTPCFVELLLLLLKFSCQSRISTSILYSQENCLCVCRFAFVLFSHMAHGPPWLVMLACLGL